MSSLVHEVLEHLVQVSLAVLLPRLPHVHLVAAKDRKEKQEQRPFRDLRGEEQCLKKKKKPPIELWNKV